MYDQEILGLERQFICANRKILMTSNSELRINPNSSIAQIAETT